MPSRLLERQERMPSPRFFSRVRKSAMAPGPYCGKRVCLIRRMPPGVPSMRRRGTMPLPFKAVGGEATFGGHGAAGDLIPKALTPFTRQLENRHASVS